MTVSISREELQEQFLEETVMGVENAVLYAKENGFLVSVQRDQDSRIEVHYLADPDLALENEWGLEFQHPSLWLGERRVNIINLTPHDVHVIESLKGSTIIVRSGKVARVSQRNITVGFLNQTLPVIKAEFGQVEGLPEKKEGTAYVVSRLVAQASPSRDDLYIPAELVRDEEGNIVGCRSLERNPY